MTSILQGYKLPSSITTKSKMSIAFGNFLYCVVNGQLVKFVTDHPTGEVACSYEGDQGLNLMDGIFLVDNNIVAFGYGIYLFDLQCNLIAELPLDVICETPKIFIGGEYNHIYLLFRDGLHKIEIIHGASVEIRLVNIVDTLHFGTFNLSVKHDLHFATKVIIGTENNVKVECGDITVIKDGNLITYRPPWLGLVCVRDLATMELIASCTLTQANAVFTV